MTNYLKNLHLTIAGLSLGLAFHVAPAQRVDAAYKADVEAFRADRTKSLIAPDGWFSLVGLEWFNPGTNAVGSATDNNLHLPSSAPAHLAVFQYSEAGGTAGLNIAPPAGGYPSGLTIDGHAASQGPLQRNAKLEVGSYTILVLERGDKLGLRIKDANAPTRVHFSGLKWFPADQKYVVKAKWAPYPTEHAINVATVIGTTLHEKVPGYAEFTIDGQTVRLEPVLEGKKLFFILRDKTSLTSTYGASRFLYTDFPPAGLTNPGELVLDFNRLTNPPCAYTDYATCPLPPQQNRLSVSIPAGEKRYHE